MIFRTESSIPGLIPVLAVIFFLSLFSSPASANNQPDKSKVPILSTTHKRQKSVNTASSDKKKQVASTPKKSLNQKPDAPKKSANKTTATTSALAKKITARSAIILDGETGKPLFSQAATQPRQPASTIKVLTGLIAIEELENNEMIPASQRAAQMPRSKIYLAADKYYRANDLINAVLLASANDASVAIAEKLAGSESAFAHKMTRKARELGAQDTVCKTASGLTAKGQQTTARDLAVIFNNAMKNKEFSRRIQRTSVDASIDQGTIRNHNKALWQIHGAQGGKTGFTNAALQTYVGKFKRGDDEIVVALLGSTTMWSDVKKLVEHGFALKNNEQKSAGNKPSNTNAMNRNNQPTGSSLKIAKL